MMDPNTENFSYYEPFDTSSITQYRASLLSLQSPSLQSLTKKKSQRVSLPKALPATRIEENNEVNRLKALIFNENKEIQYQRILEAKTQEINRLKSQMRQRSQLDFFQNNDNSNNNSRNYANNPEVNEKYEKYEEAIRFLKQNLQYSLEKCAQAHQLMSARNQKLLELISLLDSFKKHGMRDLDILQIKELKDSINRTLMNSELASKKDLELAEALKLLQEKNHENLKISCMYEKLKSRCEYFERKLQELNARNSAISEDLRLKNKNLHLEENKNTEQSKRLFLLNKIVKVLNSKDTHVLDQNNYKTIINDLVKETENLKRLLQAKDKEISHLKDFNEKIKAKSQNLTKKLEILQLKLNQNLEKNEENNAQDLSKEQFSLLNEMKLPPVLDYRVEGLPSTILNLLLDIENSGPELIFKHLLNETDSPETRAEVMRTITEQYVSFRQFSEKLNSLVYHLNKLIALTTLPDVLGYVALNLKKALDCENVRLWLDDFFTGIYYTYSGEKEIMLKVLNNRGYIGKITNEPINKINEKDIFLYEIIEEKELRKVFVDGVILIPLGNDFFNKSRGILEISGFKALGDKVKTMDYEYFVIVLSSVLKAVLARLTKESIISQERRLKSLWQDALIDLCSSETDWIFAEKVRYWSERLFNISLITFLFCEKNLFLKYVSAESFHEFPITLGIAGSVVSSQKAVVTLNMKNSPNFDSKVDLNTLMSVLTVPLSLKNGSCFGVLQIPLKDGGKVNIGEEWRENIEAMAKFFGKVVELGYSYYKKIIF